MNFIIGTLSLSHNKLVNPQSQVLWGMKLSISSAVLGQKLP